MKVKLELSWLWVFAILFWMGYTSPFLLSWAGKEGDVQQDCNREMLQKFDSVTSELKKKSDSGCEAAPLRESAQPPSRYPILTFKAAESEGALKAVLEDIKQKIGSGECTAEGSLFGFDLDYTVLVPGVTQSLRSSSEVIRDLQKLGVTTLAVTYRDAVVEETIDQVEKHGDRSHAKSVLYFQSKGTAKDIKNVGIDLAAGSVPFQKGDGFYDENGNSKSEGFFHLDDTGPVNFRKKENLRNVLYYGNGILMTSQRTKGKVLKRFLKMKGLTDRYRCIFFVDDELHNHFGLQEAFPVTHAGAAPLKLFPYLITPFPRNNELKENHLFRVIRHKGGSERIGKVYEQFPQFLNDPAQAKDKDGRTALHLVVELGDLESVEELIRLNPKILTDPDLAKDGQGINPLALAAKKGKTPLVKFFFRNNPKLLTDPALSKDLQGHDALYWAVHDLHPHSVRFLSPEAPLSSLEQARDLAEKKMKDLLPVIDENIRLRRTEEIKRHVRQAADQNEKRVRTRDSRLR